jgi:hypothetical protein
MDAVFSHPHNPAHGEGRRIAQASGARPGWRDHRALTVDPAQDAAPSVRSPADALQEVERIQRADAAWFAEHIAFESRPDSLIEVSPLLVPATMLDTRHCIMAGQQESEGPYGRPKLSVNYLDRLSVSGGRTTKRPSIGNAFDRW